MDSLPGTTVCVGRKRAKGRNEANERGEPLTVGEIVELTIRFYQSQFFGVKLHRRRLDCAAARVAAVQRFSHA